MNRSKESSRSVSPLHWLTSGCVEAETKRLEAKINAESEAEVNKIEMGKQIQAKESIKQMEEIENMIFTEREKSKADAHYYKISRMAEAEQKQLSP